MVSHLDISYCIHQVNRSLILFQNLLHTGRNTIVEEMLKAKFIYLLV